MKTETKRPFKRAASDSSEVLSAMGLLNALRVATEKTIEMNKP